MLRYYLHADPDRHIGQRNPSLAKSIPDLFPDVRIVRAYYQPIRSAFSAYSNIVSSFTEHVPTTNYCHLAHLCEQHFTFGTPHGIIKKFKAVLWQVILLRHIFEDICMQQNHAAQGENLNVISRVSRVYYIS